MEAEERRAAILEIDRATGAVARLRLRPAQPGRHGLGAATGELWIAVNERDELGDDLVPDYMTSVQEGGFYGWPYSYYGQHVDARVEPQRPDLVAQAIVPDYALGAHTASLGLAFYDGDAFPERYQGGAFVGQHGSWNRSVPSRLPGDLRAVPRRAPRRHARGRPDRLPRRGRRRAGAGRSAWRSTRPGRCWSRTTSATSSGG